VKFKNNITVSEEEGKSLKILLPPMVLRVGNSYKAWNIARRWKRKRNSVESDTLWKISNFILFNDWRFLAVA
jgi:hypothetical protein